MAKRHFESIKKRARAKRIRSLQFRLGKHLTLFVLLLLISLSFFIQLTLANNLSTKGGEIKQLEEKKNKLIYEIDLLENEKNRLNSLARIETEALEKLQMYFDVANFEYLDEINVAYKE